MGGRFDGDWPDQPTVDDPWVAAREEADEYVEVLCVLGLERWGSLARRELVDDEDGRIGPITRSLDRSTHSASDKLVEHIGIARVCGYKRGSEQHFTQNLKALGHIRGLAISGPFGCVGELGGERPIECLVSLGLDANANLPLAGSATNPDVVIPWTT